MGSVTGQIISENLLTIKSTGKIEGEVTTKTIIIEQEATLNGSCKMTSNIENKLKVEPILPNLTSVSKDGKVNK